MKKIIFIFFASTLTINSLAQFSRYFEPKTLRLDYYHCGTDKSEDFFIDELIEEPHWAGNTDRMIDDKEYGNQLFRVYDAQSRTLLYSQGYCTLFDEWQTTEEAKNSKRCYNESIVMPFPKQAVIVEFNSRDKENRWVKKMEYTVDPSDYRIRKSRPSDQTFDIVYNGAAGKKVDIVVLGEGYTESEKSKFLDDCQAFATEIFRYEPFKSRATEFNVRAVWRASQESGASMPGENIWKETPLDSRYYTFGSERYIMIDDLQKVRNLAANVPYDLIYVLSNTKKYGGGGIYNFYGISAAGDPKFAGKVYVHEFGHLFTGLGDEYGGNGIGEDGEFYPKSVEPWEENITTLVDFDRKMWKKMLPEGTEIPTENLPQSSRTIGVYEGGGYQERGIYRPWPNCLMRSFTIDEFCPVCLATINGMIDHYTK